MWCVLLRMHEEGSVQELVAEAGQYDVLLIGEVHDDAEAHRLESLLLEVAVSFGVWRQAGVCQGGQGVEALGRVRLGPNRVLIHLICACACGCTCAQRWLTACCLTPDASSLEYKIYEKTREPAI